MLSLDNPRTRAGGLVQRRAHRRAGSRQLSSKRRSKNLAGSAGQGVMRAAASAAGVPMMPRGGQRQQRRRGAVRSRSRKAVALSMEPRKYNVDRAIPSGRRYADQTAMYAALEQEVRPAPKTAQEQAEALYCQALLEELIVQPGSGAVARQARSQHNDDHRAAHADVGNRSVLQFDSRALPALRPLTPSTPVRRVSIKGFSPRTPRRSRSATPRTPSLARAKVRAAIDLSSRAGVSPMHMLSPTAGIKRARSSPAALPRFSSSPLSAMSLLSPQAQAHEL